MKVAEAIVDPRYLSRSHTIQYLAHRLTQVSVSYDRALFAVYRRPSVDGDPWPPWQSTRGDCCSRYGFTGLWLPHVEDLLAECSLVRLAKKDRPPPCQRYIYSRGGWPQELGAPIPYPHPQKGVT
jgi:hypothetical protein